MGRCHLWVISTQRPPFQSTEEFRYLTGGIRTRIRHSSESLAYLEHSPPRHTSPMVKPSEPKVVYNTDKYLYCLLVSLYYHYSLRPVKALYLPISAPFRRKANNLPGFRQKCSIWALQNATEGLLGKIYIDLDEKGFWKKSREEGCPPAPVVPIYPGGMPHLPGMPAGNPALWCSC